MSYVNRSSVMGVGVTFVATSLISVGLRFSTRLKSKMRIGADDWLCLIAMPLVVAAAAICIAGSATDTIGAHSPDIGLAIFTYESPQQQLNKKFEYAFYAIMVPALVFLKLSVLFFYRRIFQINRTFTYCFWILTVLTIAWGITFFVAWLARCGTHPENGIISLMTLTTKCINSFDVLITQATLDVATDIGILILPIPFVLKLVMPLRRKLAVLGILLIGSLSIGCGLARVIIVGWILGTPLFSSAYIAGESSTDFLGIVSLMIFWGMLELGVAMIAICLPTLRPMLEGAGWNSLMHSLKSLISLTGSRASSMGGTKTSGTFSRSSGEESSFGEKETTIQKRVDYEVTASQRSETWQQHDYLARVA